MRNTVALVKEKTSDLLLLRMEIKAIRDRVVQDLDAALAKVDAAIPEQETPRQSDMRRWDRARWRQFRETGR